MLHSGPIRNVLRTWVGTLYPFSEPSKLCIYSQSDQEHFHPDIYREEFVSDFFLGEEMDGCMIVCQVKWERNSELEVKEGIALVGCGPAFHWLEDEDDFNRLHPH